MTRPSRAGWVRFPHSPATLALLSLLVALTAGVSAVATAQATDSTLAGVGRRTLCKAPRPDAAPVPDCRVPISPRTALVRSLLVPGLAQFNLDRPKAGALFVSTEAAAIAMTFKSKHDLDLATAAKRDTIIVPVVDANNQPVIDPATGLQKTRGKPKNQNLVDRVRARRTHLEDWIAGIVFNHLFSGADGWVAANLADFNANLNVTGAGRGIQVAARVAW